MRIGSGDAIGYVLFKVSGLGYYVSSGVYTRVYIALDVPAGARDRVSPYASRTIPGSRNVSQYELELWKMHRGMATNIGRDTTGLLLRSGRGEELLRLWRELEIVS